VTARRKPTTHGAIGRIARDAEIRDRSDAGASPCTDEEAGRFVYDAAYSTTERIGPRPPVARTVSSVGVGLEPRALLAPADEMTAMAGEREAESSLAILAAHAALEAFVNGTGPAARSSSVAAATSSVKNSTTGPVVKCFVLREAEDLHFAPVGELEDPDVVVAMAEAKTQDVRQEAGHRLGVLSSGAHPSDLEQPHGWTRASSASPCGDRCLISKTLPSGSRK
jgi:hypothetical protein